MSRRLRRVSIAAFCAAASSVVLGCNSGNVGQFELEPQCVPPPTVQTALVYPAPNATGVPANFSAVILESSSTLPPFYGAYVVDTNANVARPYNTVQAVSSPLPTPNAASTLPGVVDQASSNPGITWAPGHTMTVFLNAPNCTPTQFLGTFTIATPVPTATPH